MYEDTPNYWRDLLRRYIDSQNTTTREEPTMPITQKAALEATIAAASERLARLNRFGDDVYEVGDVLVAEWETATGTACSIVMQKVASGWRRAGAEISTWEQIIGALTAQSYDVTLWRATSYERVSA